MAAVAQATLVRFTAHALGAQSMRKPPHRKHSTVARVMGGGCSLLVLGLVFAWFSGQTPPTVDIPARNFRAPTGLTRFGRPSPSL